MFIAWRIVSFRWFESLRRRLGGIELLVVYLITRDVHKGGHYPHFFWADDWHELVLLVFCIIFRQFLSCCTLPLTIFVLVQIFFAPDLWDQCFARTFFNRDSRQTLLLSEVGGGVKWALTVCVEIGVVWSEGAVLLKLRWLYCRLLILHLRSWKFEFRTIFWRRFHSTVHHAKFRDRCKFTDFLEADARSASRCLRWKHQFLTRVRRLLTVRRLRLFLMIVKISFAYFHIQLCIVFCLQNWLQI